MTDTPRPGAGMSAEMLQEALRAFGAGGASPPANAELAALAQRMGLPAAAPAARLAGPQYLLVALADTETAWPAAQVVGVERPGDITPVPNTRDWVLGVANLRGAITSVVDLRHFLGLPRQAPTPRSRVLVASANGMVIGFLVDGINEIAVIPDDARLPDPVRSVAPPWLAPFAAAAATANSRRVVLLDVAALLFADALHQYRSDS